VLAALVLGGCAPQDEPPQSPPFWVNVVWRVETPSDRAPGSLYVFLDSGTLVMTSCVETYRLATWLPIGATRVAIVEDLATRYEADVNSLDEGRVSLQLHLKDEVVALTLVRAASPFVCPDLPR
jgi:hypothetical protein